MKPLLWLVLLVFLVGVVVFVVKTRTQMAEARLPKLAADSMRAWRPLGRVPTLNESFDLDRMRTFRVQTDKLLPGLQTRCTLAGSFVASEPVSLAVIDAANVERMNKGYPPIVMYHVEESQPVRTVYPAPGGVWGFFRPAAVSDNRFPTSTSGLILALMARYADAHRPPARVTAELYTDCECYCTAAEAALYRIR